MKSESSKPNSRWRPFEEARAYVHTLGLKNRDEWKKWAKSNGKPNDIPSSPMRQYEDKWRSWGDWLGTGTIATFDRVYRPFEEARSYVHTLGLKNEGEWHEFCQSENKPVDIPANAKKVYKEKWISSGDWLGTGTIATFDRVYRPFEEARSYVHTLGLNDVTDWNQWRKTNKRPKDIPSGPNRTYKDQWQSWGDWLGTGVIANQNKVYRSFEKARAYVHSLGLKSKDDWFRHCKSCNKPDDIPNYPQIYKDQWQSWGDWLGTGVIANQNKVYRPFEEARAYVHTLGLKTQNHWRDYCKSGNKPEDIPANPPQTYGDQWRGWSDWLGIVNKWTKTATIAFLRSLQPCIHDLDQSELWAIINANGVANMINSLPDDSPLKRLVEAAKRSDHQGIDSAYADIDAMDPSDDDDTVLPTPPLDDGSDTDELSAADTNATGEDTDLPEMSIQSIVNVLSTIDTVVGVDESTLKFLKAKNMAKLWAVVLRSDDPDSEVEKLQKYLDSTQ